MRNAFLTGSQFYGSPNRYSDVDVVVRMNSMEARKIADVFPGAICGGNYPNQGQLTLRFGGLNLIIATRDETFEDWAEARNACCRERIRTGNPLHRGTAARIHQEIFRRRQDGV